MKKLFTLPPFVSVILKKDNKVLLLKRKNAKYFNDAFCLPGGKVDAGETLLQSAMRETEEELGITIDPLSAQFVHVCHFKREQGFEGLDFYLVAKNWSGQPRIMEPNKHADFDWFSLKDLPEIGNILKRVLTVDHTRHRSKTNFLVNVFSGLIAYAFREKKPSIDLPVELLN